MMKLTPLLFVILASFGPSWTQGQHTPVNCPPTISPGPTESPAPSPSPSETPTEAKPSSSLVPSAAPTNAPTTSAPSVPPTTSPTESPAPSPSPSETPTLMPSPSPSASNQPTASSPPTATSPPTTKPSAPPTQVPSPSPSESPTKQPSSPPSQSSPPTGSPSSFPSVTPTATPSISSEPSTSMSPSLGPVSVVATRITATFHGVAGEMSERNVAIFEQITLAFLILRIKSAPGTSSISFESTTVTNQSLETGRRLSRRLSSIITIEFTVEASVLFGNDGSTFDLSALLLEFFADAANLLDLRNILKASTAFFDDSQGEPVPMPSVDIGRPTDTEPEESYSSFPMVGAIFGIVFSVAGAALMFLLSRKRKEEDSVPSLNKKSLATGALSTSGDLEDQCDYSYSAGSYGEATDPSGVLINQFTLDSCESNQHSNEQTIYPAESYPAESIETSVVLSVSSFYKPALMTMESNIEIPDTPRTDYEPSSFSPREYQEGLLALDMSSSDEDKTSNSGGEEKKKLKLTSFFSPGLKSTKRKEKDSKAREQTASSSVGYMSKGSVRSPVRKDIRKHDIMGDVDAAKILARSPTRNDIRNRTLGSCSKDDSSLPEVKKHPSQEGSIDPSQSFIGIMDEVEYLYSTDKSRLKDMGMKTKRDPSVMGRPPNHSKSTINSVDNFGFVGSLQKQKYHSDYISDEESSVEQ